jgi:signal peptidase I
MRRRLVRTLTVVVVVGLVLVFLNVTRMLVTVESQGTSAMDPTIPACDGRVLAEGFTYLFRGPHRDEIVAIHARRTSTGEIRTDPEARDLTVTRRVAGLPGDQVVGRAGSVYVNGVKLDDIRTAVFSRVDLGDDQYFVVGDNRSASPDSRSFAPVQGGAIYGRVFLVLWPAGDFGRPEPRHPGAPPGPAGCES